MKRAGAAHRQALGNPLPRHWRLFPQLQRQSRLARVAFGRLLQIFLGPTLLLQPLLHQPLGALLVGLVSFARQFMTESVGVMVSLRRSARRYLSRRDKFYLVARPAVFPLARS